VLEWLQVLVTHDRLLRPHNDLIDASSLLHFLAKERSVTVLLQRVGPRVDLIILLAQNLPLLD